MEQELIWNLMERVRRAFRSGVPNGWLLGWDRERFQEELQAAARPHRLLNATSFDYQFCNTYDLEFPPLEPGRPEDVLTIRISFIADAFTRQVTRYLSRSAAKVIEAPYPEPAATIEERLGRILASKGFLEVPTEVLSLQVPGVTLELSGSVGVTLEKCLFVDYED